MKTSKIVKCECGCGTDITNPDMKGRERRFLPGHNSRLNNPGMAIMRTLPKPQTGQYWRADGNHWRTSRARARSIIDVTRCEWEHIGGCLGPIQAAHVDGDFTNGDKSNLKALCLCHHQLLDNGRIDPKNPVMPQFYTDKGGKRRYNYRGANGNKNI